MEGRKRSGMLKKSVYNMRKRLVAFALAAAMVCTNVGADLNAAYGATSSSESVTFEMTGSQLVTAIEEAIENGNVISPGDLDFTNGDIAKFESLFYGEGKVLEVYPDPDGGSMDAELRVFVRLPEDADDMYMVTGDEEIIFLYVNNGEDTVSFSTTIYDDEGGKLKSTKAIRVKSFDDAFGEEEINYISKPRETIAPAEDNGPAKEESTAPTESETAAPEEGTTAAPDEGTTVAPEETTTAAEESSSEAPSERETDSTTEAEQTEPETTEAPEINEEKAQEPEALENEAAELEAAEPESTTGEPVATITRHYAPIVADNEEGGMPEQPKADAAEEHVEEPKETTEAEVETEEKEPETTEKASEPTEVTDAMDSTEATEETSTIVPDATTEAGEEDVNPSESTSAEETTTAPAEDEETTTAVETPEVTEPVQAGTPSEVTKPEEMKPEENVNKAEKNDIVGMGYCSTAKAYVTKLKDLKVLKGQLELSATVDGAENVNVTLTANPGVVPQGSYIEATAIIDDSELELMKEAANEKLNRQNLAAVDIFAADVKLFDADGNEIQPKGSVRVAFEGTEINSSESVVYHMDDENSGISTLSLDAAEPNPYTAETVTNVDAGSDEAAFVTNHFSIYAEIETEERYYYEVNFWYAEDGQNNVLISGPQYVEEGYDAILPAAPEFDGYVFVGWDPSPQNILGDSDIYARYSKTADLIRLTVNYIYSDGTVAAQPWVAEVQAGVNCNYTIASPEIAGFVADPTVVGFNGVYSGDQTVTVTYKGGETQYQVKHYLLNPDGSQPSEPEITEILTGEVGLNTQAAAKEYEGFTPKPIAQVAIGSDGRTVVEVHYERNLYTLTWDTGDGGSYIAPTEVVYGAAVDEPVEKPTRLGYEFLGWETVPATMPAQDTVVTAKWQSVAEADYKVVYWKETLTVGEYAVAEITYGRNGTVGDNIPTQIKNYEGFALNDQKSAGSVEITADGLAVKNVYYDRGQYTIKFYRKKGILELGWQEDESLRITARYGADVSKKWENACAHDGWGPNKSGNVQYTLIANMPAENLNMYRKNAGSGKKIYYYVEGVTQGEKLTYAAFNASSNAYLTEEDKMPITGFAFDSWKQYSSDASSDLWLYYTRNSYELFFENCATMNPEKIRFEAPLSTGQPNGEPGRPANIDDDYKFAGWYLDPGFTTAVDWDSRMPAEGVTIYAKWEIPEYDVMFETNGGDSIDKITVKKGDFLSDLPVPKKAGDVFLGWYTDPQMTKKYIAESKIVKDTILYARWESSDTVNYIVKHVSSADGSVIAPEETRNAELGSTVSEAAKLINNYYPKATVLTVKITERDQEIVFEYTPVEKWTYTVKYLLEGTQDAVLGSSPFENETSDHELAVNFKSFEGYTLVSAPVVSVTKERPEAVFFYREKKAIYHTQHWFERVSYVDENERFGLHDITTTTGVESGIPVSAQALDPVPEGFTLDKSIAGTIASGTTNIQNILTMKLFYVRSSYDVKYVIDGPQPEGVIVPTGGSYKYKETVILEPTLSVPGYTFIGWETDDVALSNGRFMMPTHDVTLKGRFVENAAVEIRYVPDDAEHGSTTNSPDEVSPATGTPKGSIATAKEGYAFKNWTKDGEVVSWNAELKPE
ncbi:InlB B-repeat-containing protein, partial [Enterocloster clostridioformis]